MLVIDGRLDQGEEQTRAEQSVVAANDKAQAVSERVSE